ncbi:endonuclease/exonuclease/phosphatase family protein [Mumia sp. Pv 4-285]|uniref:endonuclease/exonuclease/phosphatase family protein n=1 Tax=Mumia qirimensis TaxID=3234852 RepID=UPI00351CC7E8
MHSLLRVLGRLVPVGLAVALASRWLDVTARGTVPAVQALAPLWVVLTALTVLGVLVLRRWRLLAWYAPALVLAAYVAATALTHDGGAVDARTPGRDFVLASLNADYGEANPTEVVALVSERHVDVLVLLEADAAYLGALDAAGMGDLMPFRMHAARDNPVAGSMILASHPLSPVIQPAEPGAYEFEQPAADLVVSSRIVRIRAVHPWPPIGGGASAWRRQLDNLRIWAGAQPDGIPVVLAGDFNASSDHPVFRRLADGFVDAVDAAGPRLAPTWPRGTTWVPPFVALDHVLSRGALPYTADTFTIDGTDHAGVIARLRVP